MALGSEHSMETHWPNPALDGLFVHTGSLSVNLSSTLNISRVPSNVQVPASLADVLMSARTGWLPPVAQARTLPVEAAAPAPVGSGLMCSSC